MGVHTIKLVGHRWRRKMQCRKYTASPRRIHSKAAKKNSGKDQGKERPSKARGEIRGKQFPTGREGAFVAGCAGSGAVCVR